MISVWELAGLFVPINPPPTLSKTIPPKTFRRMSSITSSASWRELSSSRTWRRIASGSHFVYTLLSNSFWGNHFPKVDLFLCSHLVNNYERLRGRCHGDGSASCHLCGTEFHRFRSQAKQCFDCLRVSETCLTQNDITIRPVTGGHYCSEFCLYVRRESARSAASRPPKEAKKRRSSAKFAARSERWTITSCLSHPIIISYRVNHLLLYMRLC